MNVKELEELVLSLQKKLDRATVEISRFSQKKNQQAGPEWIHGFF